MNTDSTQLKEIVKNNLISIIFIVILISPAIWLLWNDYKDNQGMLLTEINKLHDQQTKLSEKQILFEKSRAVFSTDLLEKRHELNLREMKIHQKESSLNQGKTQNNKQSINSSYEINTKVQASKKIEMLMSEFSNLGVDLNSDIYCDGVEQEKRYNQALSKYSEIYTLASAYQLENKYEHFIFKNGRMTTTYCPQRK
jgi:hypothetical protein